MTGKLFIVGIGPGKTKYMTKKAINAIKNSEVVVGYKTYLNFIKNHTTDKKTIGTGMKGEVERAEKAVKEAKNKTVSIISGGDPNIYGIAGITMEIAEKQRYQGEIEIIPGVTAFAAAGSLLKNPYNNGVCCISMSDLLTPWKDITQRAETAAKQDITTVFYNPRSHKRKENLRKTLQIYNKHRQPETEAIIAKNIARENQKIQKTTLKQLQKNKEYNKIGMRTLIIIGSQNSELTPQKNQDPENPEIIGIGPGNPEHLTKKAEKQIKNSKTIYGPQRYINQLKPILKNQELETHQHLNYKERIKTRIKKADQNTTILSGGDPSIYGHKQKHNKTTRTTPGITAYQALAAKTGAPIINDFMIKTTTQKNWLETTKKALKTDYALGIYNTSPKHIKQIQKTLPKDRPIAIGQNITRENQKILITTNRNLDTTKLNNDQNHTTLIPNSNSYIWKKRNVIITRRGYKDKYDY
ncbi:precorrin-3B C(17)-methyltransferase [Methanonatronarchaeum sp. AMET-Sl]|uniref:precorrin-3B C(17)-methyltransferase n=1 Tax=Methanonatronarchaeum sp. AMET-Sl TaxID=3037654 RepID=UPI00244DF880|nr:precorrin-3B C(17)-methyltransferase [Methanonatronarchaeum sp. AMET-Sl]WGI17920.1 precorrin-3B C(17)-methyltransferase [Methanonatronarchaeum sp. AMET-Sl]